MATPGAIDTDRDLNPSIQGSMIWNLNPAVVLPNTAQVMRGLGREDLFCVVLEHFMTNTARFTDIVLPSTTQPEYFDLLKVTDNICPGVVALPGKWSSLPVQTGAIANLLVDSACSPGGQPAYNDTFVNLENAS